MATSFKFDYKVEKGNIIIDLINDWLKDSRNLY